MSNFVESHVEEAALDWLGQLGYQVVYGPDIQPEGPYQERSQIALDFDSYTLPPRNLDVLRLFTGFCAERRESATGTKPHGRTHEY